MQIKSNLKTYEVLMEPTKAFMEKLIETENAEFVIDKNVYEIYSDLFRNISSQRLIVIEAIEKNKILDTALEICEKITEIPAKRNATLISIGSGIIQDITGFAANIIYRGIHYLRREMNFERLLIVFENGVLGTEIENIAVSA